MQKPAIILLVLITAVSSAGMRPGALSSFASSGKYHDHEKKDWDDYRDDDDKDNDGDRDERSCKQVACTLYGVNDGGGSDSQFFKLETESGLLTKIGTEHDGKDIEGFDIHPTTGILYGIKGSTSNADVYIIDKTNGALTRIGSTGSTSAKEFVSASFHPDGTFWAFGENVGLYTINLTNGNAQKIWEVKGSGIDDNWEGLAWDREGKYLYGSDGSELFQFDPASQSAKRLCGTDFLPSGTEALDFRDDGTLIGSNHNSDGNLKLFNIDFNNCSILPSDYTGISYNDIESLAFAGCAPIEKPYCEISLEKTADKTEAAPGETITYTLTFKNTGTANCTGGGVELKEFYDAQTSYLSSSITPINTNQNKWNFGTVEPNEEHTVTIEMKIADSAAEQDSITNKACVWAKEFGSKTNMDNWICDETTTTIVEKNTELSITKYVSDEDEPSLNKSNAALRGETITYTVRVQNSSQTVTARNVMLNDDYDENFVSIVSTDGTDTGSRVSWDLGDLAPGAFFLTQIDAKISSELTEEAQFDNKAYAYADNADEVLDEVSTTAIIPEENDPAQLQVIKTVTDSDDTNVTLNQNSPGSSQSYTITVTNIGGTTAENVGLADDYDEVYFTVSDAGNGTVSEGMVTYGLGDIEPGDSRTVIIAGIVNAATPDETDFKNRAVATATGISPAEAEATTEIIIPKIDLALMKMIDNDEPALNESITYTLSITNESAVNATGISVKDILPTGVEYISDTAAGTYDHASGIWTIGDIASGETKSTSITARAIAFGTIDNIAEVHAADQPDADSTPNNGIETEDDYALARLIVPQPPTPIDLALSKSINVSIVNTDTDITYTITVTNESENDATGITVREQIPEGLSYVSDTGNGSYDQTNGMWTIGDLSANEKISIEIVTIATAAGTFINTAEIASADQEDTDSTPNNNNPQEDDQASVSVTVTDQSTPLIDLALTKSASATSTATNTPFTFTLKVANDGPDQATGVTVKDVLPEGIVYVSDTSDGAYSPENGIWTIGLLDTGASTTIEITAKVTTTGSFTNTAEIVSADQEDTDSTPNNNNPQEDDQASATVIAIPTTPTFDLKLSKTVNASSVKVNDNATFTITVTNEGSKNAEGVKVRETLPQGLVYVSDSGNGAYNQSNGEWTIGTLAIGAIATLTITVKVPSEGSFTNTAEVSAANDTDIDSTPNNNNPAEDDQASATVTASNGGGGGGGGGGGCTGCGYINTPRIAIDKTVNAAFANPGQTVTYTFTVRNLGDLTAQNVTVTDTLPQGFRFLPSLASSRIWEFGDLPRDAATTTSYTVQIDASAQPGMYENLAVVTITNATSPHNRAEDRAKVEIRGSAITGDARLDIGKTASVNFTNPDTTFMYAITVQNIGLTTATAVRVEDILPEGFTFVEGGGSQKVFQMGDLASGQIKSFTYEVRVAPGVATGKYMNVATADADNTDPATANADVEIRTTQVKGLTLLPNTGVEDNIPGLFSMITLGFIGTGLAIVSRKKDGTQKRITINFIHA